MTKLHGGALVDVGNVIIDHVTAGTTRELVDTPGWYETIPPQPGAFEGLKALSQAFGGNITLVYNAMDTADRKILDWLSLHELTERTGISFDRVHRTTHGRDKTPFMSHESATHFGTTVIIDDRLEVMRYFLDRDVQHLLLFKPQIDREIAELKERDIWDFVSPVQNAVHEINAWAEIPSLFAK
jgi:hypothetical protein